MLRLLKLAARLATYCCCPRASFRSSRCRRNAPLAFVHYSFYLTELRSDDGTLRFVIKMALRNALKLVRGLRKQINDSDEDVMTIKFIEEIEMSNYQISRKSGTSGHTFEAPEGPNEISAGKG
jgi:hypothetical protein